MANKLIVAYNNLARTLDAGLPIIRALSVSAEGLPAHLKRILNRIEQNASKGIPLSETMAKHKYVFDPLDVTITAAAENSGSLSESFKMLGQWYEFKQKIRRMTISRLIYPITILVAAAFILPVPEFVLGKITLLQYLGTAIGILSIFFVPVGVVMAIIYLTPKTGPARIALDNITNFIPLLSRARYNLAIARFCWTFHMLFKAGIPIKESLTQAVSIAGNAVVTQKLAAAVKAVENGQNPSEGFSQSLPAEFAELWKIGEETGKLEEVTKKLADHYSESAEFLFNELSVWLPRLIYFLILAVMVCMIFYALSNITSAYNIPE